MTVGQFHSTLAGVDVIDHGKQPPAALEVTRACTDNSMNAVSAVTLVQVSCGSDDSMFQFQSVF